MRDFVAEKVKAVPPSGIRRFFDIGATMDDVISLGIGEPICQRLSAVLIRCAKL